jgi:VCBS repeat-containing protein
LHIGTNDVSGSLSTQAITNNVNSILDEIDQYSENITVLVARIISRMDGRAVQTTNLNNSVEQMVLTRVESGDKLILMDMESDAGLDYQIDQVEPFENDFWDTLHPNKRGYGKMGTQWLTGLTPFLPRFAPPLIYDAQSPLVATLEQPFEYQIKADGMPTPTFSLEGAIPEGMDIEPGTGILRWTPQSRETATVTVNAVNSIPSGTSSLVLVPASDSLDFSIEVNTAPMANGATYSLSAGKTLTVDSSEGVLANDTDFDNDPLTANLVSTAAHGSLNLNPDGSFEYSHDGGETTADRFIYQASDGYAFSTATVNLEIEPAAPGPNPGGGDSGGGGGCFIQIIGKSWPVAWW